MKKIILVLLVLTFKISFAQTGWFWQSPKPTGNQLSYVKFLNANTACVTGTNGMFLKTTNAGGNWVYNNLLHYTFDASQNNYCYPEDMYATNENTLYALFAKETSPYSSFFVLKSLDAGETWDSIFVGTGNFTLNKISFVNSTTGYAYSTAFDPGVYKTTNAGMNWERYKISATNDSISNVFFINENTGWMGASYFSNNYYKTTNGGSSWATYTLPGKFYTPYFINPNTGWVINYQNVYKTTNGGINFTVMSSIPINFFGQYSFFSENNGWAIFDSQFYLTTNSGANWTRVTDTGYPKDFRGANFFDQNTGIMVGEFGQICKTTNGGSNWKKYDNSVLSQSNIRTDVKELNMVNDNTGWALNGKKVIKTSDGGDNWSGVDTAKYYFSIKFINENTGLLAGNESFKFTTNGGASFNNVNYSDFNFLKISMPSNSTWYLLGGNDTFHTTVILRTTNAGVNWSTASLPPTDPNDLQFFTESTGYAAYNGTIFKTTNSGMNWQSVSSRFLNKIYFINEATGWGFQSDYLYKTTNSGVNWQQQVKLIFGVWQSIQFINPNTGWAVWGFSDYGEIYKTTNGGMNWEKNFNYESNALYSVSFINENTGWIGGQAGEILKTTTGGSIGIQQISTTIPDKFYLEQNYPNPFNPNTKIEFSLPQKSFVRLKVFDLLGREIANLVNENLSAGSYKYDFNASPLPSGIYFYKLETENFFETRKMVLIK